MTTAAIVIGRSNLPLDTSAFSDVTFSEMPLPLRTLLGARADAITLRRRIYIHPRVYEEVVSGGRPDLVIHELMHTRQWQSEGAWFLPRYAGQYVRCRLMGLTHELAYRAISYEAEAFAEGASVV